MTAFADYVRSANITNWPQVYELENRAFDPAGHVLAAMARLAPWGGRTLVDLGCGTGFWLPIYAPEAERVIGLEPEPGLRARARDRIAPLANVEVRAGSAERTGLPDASVDVVHARFAYFLGPGREAGLAEVMRILRPGGALVVVDNDYGWGEFARLMELGFVRGGRIDPDAVAAFWRRAGAERVDVRSEWVFDRPADLAAVLRIELPRAVADGWVAAHPTASSLTYGYTLWAVRRPASGLRIAAETR